MPTQLKHDAIGELSGRPGDGVLQFLGIKYASLKNGFSPSELVEYSGHETIDGTKLGLTAINPPDSLDNEFGFIQKSLPVPDFTASALDCLNLNITIPQASKAGQNLPVFVFVHGGGFGLGSNAWPQYDQARIVKLSKDLGLPVIGVGLNYRVNLTGFLTSAEMQEAGYVSNNGLRDQVNAFKWVKKYIHGFGGDPENVTFIGESAGAVAGNLLLHSKESLFNRYISMSGTSLMLNPLPPPVAEFAYSSIVGILGLNSLSASERVQALVDTPPEKLLALVPPAIPLLPITDGEFITSNASFAALSAKGKELDESLPGRKWCETIVIGDCAFDGSILAFMLGPRTAGLAKAFCSSVSKTFSSNPAGGEKVLATYGISSDQSDAEALKPVLNFSNDISFYAPAVAVARSWLGTAYLYHFDEPNPWEGQWKGEATHILDVAYLFQNYDEYLDSKQKEVAVAFAKYFINIMNRKNGWTPFTETNQGAQMFGPSDQGVSTKYVGNIRSMKIFELGDEVGGLDLLAKVWTDFFTGQG